MYGTCNYGCYLPAVPVYTEWSPSGPCRYVSSIAAIFTEIWCSNLTTNSSDNWNKQINTAYHFLIISNNNYNNNNYLYSYLIIIITIIMYTCNYTFPSALVGSLQHGSLKNGFLKYLRSSVQSLSLPPLVLAIFVHSRGRPSYY